MRPIIPARGVLEQLSDFGNEKPKARKEKKYNWQHALVTSDEVSCGEQAENTISKPVKENLSAKKGGQNSCDMSIFATLSGSIGSGSDDDESDGESHGTADSNRAKLVTTYLRRIAEEPEDENVVENSFNKPNARSFNGPESATSPRSYVPPRRGNRSSYSDDHTELATDIAGNLSSMRAQKDRDDTISLFSFPASDINSTMSPRKRDDNMDLMSFFSEPATEIMGNLTSAGLRKDHATDSSLHGEQFLSEIETRDSESLFSEDEEKARKMPQSARHVLKSLETPRISNKNLSAVVTARDGAKDGEVSWSKSQDLTVPDGSKDATEQTTSVAQPEIVKRIPQSVCVAFVTCALVSFITAIAFIVIALPTLMNDSPSPYVPDSERSKAIWNLAVSVSGTASLNDMSSPAFQAYDWMLRSDSFSTTETSSEILKERFVVSLLYFSTGGETWNEKNNFLSEQSICAWNISDEKNELGIGIGCDTTSRVKHIILVENNLAGTIPVEVLHLDHLEILDLSRNFLDGSIPSEIGETKALLELNLMSNNIQGQIPSALGKLGNLVSLDLSSNSLTGSLPTELGNLGVLERLSLGDNELKGRIPESMQYIQNLTELNLFRNGFHGDIPSGVADLPYLTILNLASNNFTGDFSDDFCETGRSFDSFWADCRGDSPMVQCPCCTICCKWNGEYLECY